MSDTVTRVVGSTATLSVLFSVNASASFGRGRDTGRKLTPKKPVVGGQAQSTTVGWLSWFSDRSRPRGAGSTPTLGTLSVVVKRNPNQRVYFHSYTFLSVALLTVELLGPVSQGETFRSSYPLLFWFCVIFIGYEQTHGRIPYKTHHG